VKTRDIYQKYNLMPQLATHQLRVAGVAKLISDDWNDRAEAELGVRACLLHDMGNMAKFSGLTDPYWVEQQQQFWKMWGKDAHEATFKIIAELRQNSVLEVLRDEGKFYNQIPPIDKFAESSKPALLVLYGDLRVAMEGVVSLAERVADLDTRYPDKIRPEKLWGKGLEAYMQSLTEARVSKIGEGDVVPLFDELMSLEW
jgi:hypothetical protein